MRGLASPASPLPPDAGRLAFNCFIKDARTRVRAERKGMPVSSTSPQAISVEVTRRWLALPEEEQRQWVDIARKKTLAAATRKANIERREDERAAEVERAAQEKQRAIEAARKRRAARGTVVSPSRNRRASRLLRVAMTGGSSSGASKKPFSLATATSLNKAQREAARMMHEHMRTTYGVSGLLAWMANSTTGFAKPNEEGGFNLPGVSSVEEEDDGVGGDRLIEGHGGIGGTRRRLRQRRGGRRRQQAKAAKRRRDAHTEPSSVPTTSSAPSSAELKQFAGEGGNDEDTEYVYDWLGYFDYSDEDSDDDAAMSEFDARRSSRSSSSSAAKEDDDYYIEAVVKPMSYVDESGDLRVRPQRWNVIVDRRKQRVRTDEAKVRRAQEKRLKRMEQAKRDLFDRVESWSTGTRGHGELLRMMGRIDDQIAGIGSGRGGGDGVIPDDEPVSRFATRILAPRVKQQLRVNIGAVQMCSQWDERPMMPSMRENFAMTDSVGNGIIRNRYKTEDQYTHRTYNAVANQVSSRLLKLSNKLAQTMTPVMLSDKAKRQPRNSTKVFRDGQLVSKVLFFRGGYVVDGLSCIISVFGIGIQGRVLAVGNSAPRYLLLEAYCSFDGSLTTLQLTLSDIIDALGESKAGELMIPGKKVELVDAIVSRIRITQTVKAEVDVVVREKFDFAAAEADAEREAVSRASSRPATSASATTSASGAGELSPMHGSDELAPIRGSDEPSPPASRGSHVSRSASKSPSHRSASPRRKRPKISIEMRIAHWTEQQAEEEELQRNDAAALAIVDHEKQRVNGSAGDGDGGGGAAAVASSSLRPDTGTSAVSFDIVGGTPGESNSSRPDTGLTVRSEASTASTASNVSDIGASLAAALLGGASMKKKLKALRGKETKAERKERKRLAKIEKKLNKERDYQALLQSRGKINLDAPPPPLDDDVTTARQRATRQSVPTRKSIMASDAPTSMKLGYGPRRLRLVRVTRRLSGARGAAAIVSVYVKHVWSRVLYCEAYFPATSTVYPLPVSVVDARRELFDAAELYRAKLVPGGPLKPCGRRHHIARARDGSFAGVCDAIELTAGSAREAFAIVSEYRDVLGDGEIDEENADTAAKLSAAEENAIDADEDALTWPDELRKRVALRIAAHVDLVSLCPANGRDTAVHEVALGFNGDTGTPYGVQSAPPRGVAVTESYSSTTSAVAAATSIIATTTFVEANESTTTILRRLASDGSDAWSFPVRAVSRPIPLPGPGRTTLRKPLRQLTGEEREGKCVARGVEHVRIVYPYRRTFHAAGADAKSAPPPQVAMTRGGKWQEQPRRARAIFHVFRRKWLYVKDPLEVKYDTAAAAAAESANAAPLELAMDGRPISAGSHRSAADMSSSEDEDLSEDVGDLFADSDDDVDTGDAEEGDGAEGGGKQAGGGAAAAQKEKSETEESTDDEVAEREHEAARLLRLKQHALAELCERDDIEIRIFVPDLCFQTTITLAIGDIATMLIGTDVESEIGADESIIAENTPGSAERLVRALLGAGRLHLRAPPPPPADPLDIPDAVAALDDTLAHYATKRKPTRPLAPGAIEALPSRLQKKARRRVKAWNSARSDVLAAALWKPVLHADRRVLRCVLHIAELPPEKESDREEGALRLSFLPPPLISPERHPATPPPPPHPLSLTRCRLRCLSHARPDACLAPLRSRDAPPSEYAALRERHRLRAGPHVGD